MLSAFALCYSNLREKTSPMFVIGTRPWEELYDKDICLNLQWQLGVLVEEEMSGSVKT